MLSVTDARALMLARIKALGAEEVDLSHACGRTLAEPVIATRDQPPFAASAMDGYALAAATTPRDVTVVGESAAGRGYLHALKPNQAVRISTGAPMPEGADGVLIQEDAKIEAGCLIAANVTAGRHVRPRGGDFHAGATLLERGRVADPIAIGLAAGAGAGRLAVIRQPRVTVFAGGDELALPGEVAGADQIYESGSFALCGLIDRWGGLAQRAQALPDNPARIAEAAGTALDASDLVVMIGGASVGPHDHARAALSSLGVDVIVPKIAVQPGKPTWFGVSTRGLVLGLPGNAASAVVCALLFLRPILEAMLSRDPHACLRLSEAPLATELKSNGAREQYLRARVGEDGRVSVFANQDSSLMSVLAQSNALLLREPNAPHMPAGAVARYLPLGD